MTKIMKLVKLDIQTAKPYVRFKNLAIFNIVWLLVGIVSGNPLIPIVGIMGYVSGYISAPFSIGERYRLDILHATFSVSRREIVLGRYIYAFILNAISAAASYVVISFAFYSDDSASATPFFFAILVIIYLAQYLIIAAVQIPIFYKVGYAKSSIFSSLPYITVLTTLAFVLYIVNYGVDWLTENALLVCLTALSAGLMITAVSFLVSCKFYEKRDL